MYGIVEAANLLDEVELSERAYELLRPFARLPMVSSLAVACFGSTQHALGVASLTVRAVDRAVDHFAAAVHDNLALGHWPAAVLSRWRHGQALALRAGPRDLAEARHARTRAEEDAAALGMVLPSTRWAAATGLTIHRDGPLWRVALGYRAVLVEHRVGLRHLAVLCANPGREITAVELAAGAGPLPAGASDRLPQPVLDATARQEYRQRLCRLPTDIDEHERRGDAARAATARSEYDWLRAELAAGTAVGGRPRHFTDTTERARIAVGKAIRRAIDRLAEADPIIAEHLRGTVRTGLHCSYHPHTEQGHELSGWPRQPGGNGEQLSPGPRIRSPG